MSKKEDKEKKALEEEQQEMQPEENLNQEEQETTEETQEEVHEETDEEKIARLEAELEKEKKEYVFLLAEFDNFRKRTLREKQDLVKNGAERAMLELLPVIDDMRTATSIALTATPSVASRYENGTEDYQMLMSLEYFTRRK